MAGTEDKRPREPRESPVTPPAPVDSVSAPEPSTGVSKAPGRKVLAGIGGSGLGGYIAVIVAYNFPDLPPEVAAAYSGLLITVLGAFFAYLVPEN